MSRHCIVVRHHVTSSCITLCANTLVYRHSHTVCLVWWLEHNGFSSLLELPFLVADHIFVFAVLAQRIFTPIVVHSFC